MKHSLRSLQSAAVVTTCLAALTVVVACSAQPDGDDGSGGTSPGVGGAKGGNPTGGASPTAGTTSSSGKPGVGGLSGVGGAGSSGGSTGGHAGSAGSAGHVGGSNGGVPNGGAGSDGESGGRPDNGSGGTTGAGGSGGDACAVMGPLSGGNKHASNNQSGMAAGLAWTIWSNTNAGSITTYDTPAFSAEWNNAGDFLARVGLQWNASKTYDQYGTISAQFNSKKSGTAGGYSYIGIYGWSVSPCVEWYIVDDSWNKMPVNPGNTTNKGTADIDGGKYTLYTRNTTGTGGSKCPGTSSWVQFYSVRQTARSCGTISITEHFNAWKTARMELGKMDQAQILVEVGGGQGSIEFSVANVTAK